MSESTRNPQTVSAAFVHAQAARYTDERFEALSARLDAVQVAVKASSERNETVRCRVKFIDRMVCVIIAAVLAVILDRATGLPHIAVIGIGTLPECAREVFEFLRRL